MTKGAIVHCGFGEHREARGTEIEGRVGGLGGTIEDGNEKPQNT